MKADVRFARDAAESALLLDAAAADLVGGMSLVEVVLVAWRGDTTSDVRVRVLVGALRDGLDMSCAGN